MSFADYLLYGYAFVGVWHIIGIPAVKFWRGHHRCSTCNGSGYVKEPTDA